MKIDPLSETKRLHADALTRIMFESYLETSRGLETFASYALAATAGFAALSVSNLAEIIALIGSTGFRLSLAFVLGSIAFGLVAKLYGFRVAQGLKISEILVPKLKDELKRHGELISKLEKAGIPLEDHEQIQESATAKFNLHLPFWQQPKESEDPDPHSDLISIVSWYTRQQIAAFAQGICLVGLIGTIGFFA